MVTIIVRKYLQDLSQQNNYLHHRNIIQNAILYSQLLSMKANLRNLMKGIVFLCLF